MKRKKLLIKVGITIGVIFAIYLVVRFTGGLRFYTSPTSANSPQIAPNDYLFVSNWITPERFDFVCYEAFDEFFGFGTFTHRLCGLPGDTIEIINGDLYVNGRNADKNLNVQHNYLIPAHKSGLVRTIQGVEYLGRNNPLSDSIRVSMNSSLLASWMEAEQIVDNENIQLHPKFPSVWTSSNFGPLIIPEGKVFLLGDNRDNSIDSRVRGLTNESDITGVVFNKE